MANVSYLEPAITNTGFVGTIALENETEKYFAVLLHEGLDSSNRAENLGLAHEQLRLLRPPLQTFDRSSSNGASKFGLRKSFNQPEDFGLRSVNQIQNALIKGLRSESDSFTISCANRQAYAELCCAIGITRSDHTMNAELSSLIDGALAHKSQVVGSAHKLLDVIYKERHTLNRTQSEYDRNRRIRNHFLSQVPIAAKFVVPSAGDGHANEVESVSLDAFRLPYPVCLIEGSWNGLGEIELPGFYSTYFLATQLDERSFVAEPVVRLTANTNLYFGTKLYWNMEGDKLHRRVDHRGTEEIPEIILSAMKNAHQYLLSSLAIINNPAVQAAHYEAPATRRARIGKRQRAPFYDCYDLSSSSRTTRKIGEAFGESGRVLRAHQRRGHVRQFTHPRYTNMQGKTVWIDAMQVGEPRNGVIAKGYDFAA